MSKRYICDRCGREKAGHCATDINLSERLVRDIGWIRIMSRSGYSNDLDFCEECLNSFKDWFENSQK